MLPLAKSGGPPDLNVDAPEARRILAGARQPPDLRQRVLKGRWTKALVQRPGRGAIIISAWSGGLAPPANIPRASGAQIAI